MTEKTQVLNAKRVSEIFRECLFKDGEDHDNYVKAEGITVDVGFHPGRLEKNKEEIASMLDELPDDFKVSGGGGMSFLQACVDKHGNQWTGMHQTMEEMFLLGLATGKVNCLLPRETWGILPGGVPYYSVN